MLSARVEGSLAPIVERWAKQDKKRLRPLFEHIASGRSICGTGLTVPKHTLDAGLAELDSGGRVTELFGITRKSTPHRIEYDGNTVFSCCALVAHTVPAIFGKAATVVSNDPVSGAQIRIRISANLELQDARPPTSYGSLVDCHVDELMENPRTNYCRHVKHFTDASSVAAFCNAEPRRYAVPISEFHAAAVQLFGHIWPD